MPFPPIEQQQQRQERHPENPGEGQQQEIPAMEFGSPSPEQRHVLETQVCGGSMTTLFCVHRLLHHLDGPLTMFFFYAIVYGQLALDTLSSKAFTSCSYDFNKLVFFVVCWWTGISGKLWVYRDQWGRLWGWLWWIRYCECMIGWNITWMVLLQNRLTTSPQEIL